jgi:hypothetical protein
MKHGLDLKLVSQMDVLLGVLRDLDYEFDGIYAFVSRFLLVNVPYFFIDLDLFGKELLLIPISLVEEVNLLHLYLSVFGCDHGNALYTAKQHELPLSRSKQSKIEPIKHIHLLLSENGLYLLPRVRYHLFDLMGKLTVKLVEV